MKELTSFESTFIQQVKKLYATSHGSGFPATNNANIYLNRLKKTIRI